MDVAHCSSRSLRLQTTYIDRRDLVERRRRRCIHSELNDILERWMRHPVYDQHKQEVRSVERCVNS